MVTAEAATRHAIYVEWFSRLDATIGLLIEAQNV